MTAEAEFLALLAVERFFISWLIPVILDKRAKAARSTTPRVENWLSATTVEKALMQKSAYPPHVNRKGHTRSTAE